MKHYQSLLILLIVFFYSGAEAAEVTDGCDINEDGVNDEVKVWVELPDAI